MKGNRLVLLTGMVLSLMSASAWSFSGYGHRLICRTAQQALPAEVAQQLNTIARQGGAKNFADLCTWPDQIRKKSEFKHTKTWHYINVSRKAERVSASDCGRQGCVTEALRQQWQLLKQQPQNWQALAFVGHFIGDVHQPMHVSYSDDRGGNRLRLQFDGERTNLHQYWDGRLLQYQPQTLKPVRLTSKPMKLPVYDWASESLQITRQIYRQPHKTIEAGSELHQQHVTLWNQQASLAAQRLADALNSVYRGNND